MEKSARARGAESSSCTCSRRRWEARGASTRRLTSSYIKTLLAGAIVAVAAWAVPAGGAVAAAGPRVPLRKIFSELQALELEPREMKDLQKYMKDRSARLSEDEGEEGEFDWKQTLSDFKVQMGTLQKSRVLRQEGNELLAGGNADAAEEKYRGALDLLEAESVLMTDGTKRCIHSCRLNIAACEARRGEVEGARETYSSILAEEPDATVKVRCLAKRARLARRIGDDEAALADLTEANRLDPLDRTVAGDLRDLGGTPVSMPVPIPTGTAFPNDFTEMLMGSFDQSAGLSSLLGGIPLGASSGQLASKLMSSMVSMLDRPQTLEMVCRLAKNLTPEYIRSLAETANIPIADGTVEWIHRKAVSLRPEDLRKWVTFGKRAHRTYKATQRTYKAAKPLLKPARVLLTYALMMRWVYACVRGR